MIPGARLRPKNCSEFIIERSRIIIFVEFGFLQIISSDILPYLQSFLLNICPLWTWHFISTNLEALSPLMLCAKIGWNLPHAFREDENFEILWRPQRETMNKFWTEKITRNFGSGDLNKYKVPVKECFKIDR